MTKIDHASRVCRTEKKTNAIVMSKMKYIHKKRVDYTSMQLNKCTKKNKKVRIVNYDVIRKQYFY